MSAFGIYVDCGYILRKDFFKYSNWDATCGWKKGQFTYIIMKITFSFMFLRTNKFLVAEILCACLSHLLDVQKRFLIFQLYE